MEDLLQVGVITTTHGVRGEVKVFPTTDDPARFKKLKNVILDTGKEKLELEIAGVKFFKNMVILKFKGIDDINDVEKYRKKSLYVTRENAVKLKKDEYFIADLIGMKVSTDEGEELGTLSDVMQTGANDVYVISMTDGEEVLIPAIRDCIRDVDVEQGQMCVHLLPGLLDINRKYEAQHELSYSDAVSGDGDAGTLGEHPWTCGKKGTAVRECSQHPGLYGGST